MSFQEDKNRLIEYMTQHSGSSDDEQELEEFFVFIDELEDKAKEEKQYYSLIADACMETGDIQKAKESFLKVYNPKNKKDIRKLMNYDRVKAKPIVRPCRRAKILSDFKYADKAVLTNKFIMSDCACSICQKEAVPLYVGTAYISCSEEINFFHRTDKFCAECIRNGAAAKKFNIKFNSPLLEECKAFDSTNINELLYATPECSSEFDDNEDIWAGCCGDFCRYVKRQYDGGDKFHFKCIHCGKEIVWIDEG